MGTFSYTTIVVSDWDGDQVKAAHEKIAALYADAKTETGTSFGRLVSALVEHVVNGGNAFLIAPDGSKEGWGTSNMSDDLAKKAKAILEEHRVAWAEVLLGGDHNVIQIADRASGHDAEFSMENFGF